MPVRLQLFTANLVMPTMKTAVHLFWFRRDLRLDDNHGLFRALSAGLPVVPVFIFDTDILDHLEDRDDRRVTFLHDTLTAMQQQLAAIGSTLDVRYGKPLEILALLLAEYNVAAVYTNHDYEPYASERDGAIRGLLEQHGAALHTFKDQVIFEKSEVVKNDGLPYGVYTPYSKKWKAQLQPSDYASFDSMGLMDHFYRQPEKHIISLEAMGFNRHPDAFPDSRLNEEVVKLYHQQRDYPALPGTSRLGVHLRFGTVSIRRLVSSALKLNETFLGELIWREFFMQLLWHYPRLAHQCHKQEYEAIRWRNNEAEFEAWCAGRTGYPIVDAGMRELNATGFMHNRVRMVVASFLVKHLLIDWKLGEHYFGRKLLDYDMSANVCNWQWVAGCGCDAAPYFRIFNPASQAKKFDGQEQYIRRWVPEYKTRDYALPIVDHEFARKRCLSTYKDALQLKMNPQPANRLFSE